MGRPRQPLARIVRGLIVLASAPFVVASAAAQTAALPMSSQRLEGVGPDGQISGGVGLGFDRELPNAFLGRARLGVLYVYEPWFFNAGVTLEVGGLAALGIGGELEWNEFDGLYANLGLARLDDDRLMGHFGVGYTIFGLEWQHGFGSVRPHNALLFEVRLPLGFWWFSHGRKDRRHPPPRAARPAAATRDGARLQPVAAEPPPPLVGTDSAAPPGALTDPEELRRTVDRQLEAKQLVAAAETLRRYIAAETASPSRRAEAEARAAALQARLPRLRLSLQNARGDERVEVDGAPQPGLLLGYDLPLDPGEHTLRIMRGERALHERAVLAREGELLRLDISLEAP